MHLAIISMTHLIIIKWFLVLIIHIPHNLHLDDILHSVVTNLRIVPPSTAGTGMCHAQ